MKRNFFHQQKNVGESTRTLVVRPSQQQQKLFFMCVFPYIMGIFYKNFFFFNYSLLVKKGKIPLKTGPDGNDCLQGLSFLLYIIWGNFL